MFVGNHLRMSVVRLTNKFDQTWYPLITLCEASLSLISLKSALDQATLFFKRFCTHAWIILTLSLGSLDCVIKESFIWFIWMWHLFNTMVGFIYLLVFPFVYQFNSRLEALVCSSFANDYSEVPNRRACSLKFFRFSFHPARNFLPNKRKIPPCSFIDLLSKKPSRVTFFPTLLVYSGLLVY